MIKQNVQDYSKEFKEYYENKFDDFIFNGMLSAGNNEIEIPYRLDFDIAIMQIILSIVNNNDLVVPVSFYCMSNDTILGLENNVTATKDIISSAIIQGQNMLNQVVYYNQNPILIRKNRILICKLKCEAQGKNTNDAFFTCIVKYKKVYE